MASLTRLADESLDQYYDRLREKSDCEDLAMFINACFAATNQNDFYNDRFQQSLSLDFLHAYVLTNFRRLYAQVLAAGINHFNQSVIIFNLLRAGAPTDRARRSEEGELIWAALRSLPANRAFRLLCKLQQKRVNNRRTRAITKRFLQWRRDPDFDAIKYRNKVRAAVSHAHVELPDELGAFLFELKRRRRFERPMLEQYRKAYYSAAAVYELPFTVAESLANKHKIPRDEFYAKIQPKMSKTEKLRFQTSSAQAGGMKVEFDLQRAPLTKLILYVLSLPDEERMERAVELDQAICNAAKTANSRSSIPLRRVAAVLDHSRSSMGSRQRRNRPLAIAVGVSYLLRESAAEYKAFWTPDTANDSMFDFQRNPNGQTALAERLIDALEWGPDLVVIVSDGYENDPPLAVEQIARVYREKITTGESVELVHANPVFDADHFAPKPLGPSISTVGATRCRRPCHDVRIRANRKRFLSTT